VEIEPVVVKKSEPEPVEPEIAVPEEEVTPIVEMKSSPFKANTLAKIQEFIQRKKDKALLPKPKPVVITPKPQPTITESPEKSTSSPEKSPLKPQVGTPALIEEQLLEKKKKLEEDMKKAEA
jgi:hypothetical protein